MKASFSISDDLTARITQALQSLQIELSQTKRIADCVLRMSDFYIDNPSGKTPWHEPWCQIAQIAYYLPLNFLRNQAVYSAAKEVKFDLHTKHLIDYGCGLGAGSSAWTNSAYTIYCESSNKAKDLLEKYFNPRQARCEFMEEKDLAKLNSFSTIFSYSLTELSTLPKWALASENIVIVEPSTQDDGRKLLKLREQLQTAGFYMWAPCTHQGKCPLYTQSKTDWCHDRISFDIPEWFQQIEKNLPIKNSTLTFSYLIASRKQPPVLNKWRVVGDVLPEKGKTRQLVCRGEEREFLAWMHKKGDFITFERGELIEPPLSFEKKSNEIRL